MKVILLQEVKGKGGEGDVIDVARGFANNYLFPRNIAVLATDGNLKQLEQRKHNIAKREETRLADANKLKETIEGAVVKVDAKVGEEGQLFGSITSAMIAQAIKEAVGTDIDKRSIELGHAIKTAGTHEVGVSLYRGIRTSVKLVVGDEAAQKAAEAAAAAPASDETAAADALPDKPEDAPAQAEAPAETAAATAE